MACASRLLLTGAALLTGTHGVELLTGQLGTLVHGHLRTCAPRVAYSVAAGWKASA